MPSVGDQHFPSTSSNPFDEGKNHMSEYTAQDIATLSSRLEKQLGPEYISSRPGAGGGKVHYLSADKSINLANEVFGFNGWSSSIQQVQIDFVDESPNTGKINLGLSVIVRVTLKDGTFHEDIGYGHIENCKGKAPAFEKAKKEGTTDALKRALRNFGNLLGNCLYDKVRIESRYGVADDKTIETMKANNRSNLQDYIAKVTKLKVAPTKWSPQHLHRHPDFAPTKMDVSTDGAAREVPFPNLMRNNLPDLEDARTKHPPGDGEDEFGSDDFDEVDFSVPCADHPDEVSLDTATSSTPFRRKNSLPNKGTSIGNQMSMPRSPPSYVTAIASERNPQTPRNGRGPANASTARQDNASCQPQIAPAAQRHSTSSIPPLLKDLPHSAQGRQPSNDPLPESNINAPLSHLTTHEPPMGFYTARAAESLQSGTGTALGAPAFDPHLESPSIRKTAGVDHTKTQPVNRELVAAPTAAPPPRASFIKPSTDKTRKLGMPSVSGPQLQNRGSYKPPQMKRCADENVSRAVLNDVTPNVAAGVGNEKRQRTGLEG